jgi:two-component system heavy metal sensor histidine kinase CusS
MIRISSFRVKIALISVILSGLALAALGVSSWIVFYKIGLDRIDQQIQGRGRQQLSKFRDRQHWERYASALHFIFGETERESFILLMKDRDGKILHISPHWPGELETDGFPSPNQIKDYMQGGAATSPEDSSWSVSDRPGRAFDRDFPGAPPPSRLLILQRSPYTQRVGDEPWRFGVMANEHVTLAMGVNLENFHAEMRRVANAFLIILPATLLLLAGGGWMISQQALRPVRRVTETAEQITAAGLDRRIPLEAADVEFQRLVTVVNQMLDRLEGSFQQAVRFSADAAHELKTPLTILQGELEQALQTAESSSEAQQFINGLLEEVQRLKAIVQKLLLLSLADSGQLKPNLERVNLSEFVEAACEDTRILAPELNVAKEAQPDLHVMADTALLRHALLNLTSNAVKYNRRGGTIEFRLCQRESLVELTISNSGEAIPAAHRDRIFDRFFRGDESRGRRIDGVGLGLSLAREILRAHGGDLVLREAGGEMTAFAMTLPSAERQRE